MFKIRFSFEVLQRNFRKIFLKDFMIDFHSKMKNSRLFKSEHFGVKKSKFPNFQTASKMIVAECSKEVICSKSDFLSNVQRNFRKMIFADFMLDFHFKIKDCWISKSGNFGVKNQNFRAIRKWLSPRVLRKYLC